MHLFCFVSEETTSSVEKEVEFNNKIETNRGRRFDFLLKQTEICTHFMTNSTKSPTKPKGRPKKIKDPKEPKDIKDKDKDKGKGKGKDEDGNADHRHRKTEQEEDEELLADDTQYQEWRATRLSSTRFELDDIVV